MLSKIMKFLGKTAKKTKQTVDSSMEFVDDILEKEAIVSAVDKAKEMTGNMVEKAGTLYENTLTKADEFIEEKGLTDVRNKVINTANSTLDSAKEVVGNVIQSEPVQSTYEAIKSKTQEAIDKIEDTIIGEEE